MNAVSAQVERLYPTPLPPALPPVPELDPLLIPQCMRTWVVESADALQTPLEFVAAPALTALAGCIGRQLAVRLKRLSPWFEYPILWGILIGRPSSGKSPAISPARRMLDRLESDARGEFDAACRTRERTSQLERLEAEMALRSARRLVSLGDKRGAEAALAAVGGVEQVELGEPRLVINDTTTEKLGEILAANPRGIICVRDEVSGWLSNLDREGRENDRAFYLEAWNGKGSYTVDRIGRGTTRIEACAMSFLGGMQPGKLAEYVRGAVKGGAADDGLLQRFQMSVYPDLSPAWRFRDFAPDPNSERNVLSLFRYVYALDPSTLRAESDDSCSTPYLRLSDGAQERFADWLTALMQRIRSGGEPPHLESHLSKYSALAGRLSLVLHLAERGTGQVSDAAMSAAIEWCGFLEAHARRIYASVSDNGVSTAHALMKKRSDLAGDFTVRDVYRKGWTGLADRAMVEAGLEMLVDHGYMRSWVDGTTDQGGRPSAHYQWLAY